jgi:Mycoplasma protein of unknown function, DUF285
VSLVTDFSSVFQNYGRSSLDLSQWDVSSATDMSQMFMYAYVRHSVVAISTWDTSNVVSMARMFYGSQYFDQDLALWNTQNVVNMTSIFETVSGFTGRGLDQWRVPRVTDLSRAFKGSSSFRANLCGWGQDLFGRSVLLHNMLDSTDCISTERPDLTVFPVNPLCLPCGA